MADIQLVDVSMRDGNQSLWGARGLNTAQMLAIAPVMERVGFAALDFTSSTHMGMAVRTFHEDPWERLRRMHELMPTTPLQFIGTGFRFYSWETQHPEFMQLAYDRLVANGVERFIVLDPMHDEEAIMTTARMYRQAGATQIVGALVYTVSDVHTDAYYADLAGKMAASPDFDRVYLKDPSGLLRPTRARTLLPAIRARLGGKPLELHSHCTIGQASLSYMEAAEHVDVLHVACGPLADGSSLPSAEQVVANLRALGHNVHVDDHALRRVCRYFEQLAEAEGLPVGAPQEFNAAFLRHQVAGGVMSTTRRQMAELNLEHRFPDVMGEVTRVRAELGFPIMVTPFPQMVCTQALYNVIGNERYDNVSDQVIRYAMGRFGRPNAPIDPEILERILARPRARELSDEPEALPLAEMRAQFSPELSDEEFLLRAVMPAEQVDAMLAAGPSGRHYTPELQGVLKLLKALGQRPTQSRLALQVGDMALDLRAVAHKEE